jgi:DNA-binding NarL/FixJ family response regulator
MEGTLSYSPTLSRVLVFHPNPVLASAICGGLELAGPFTAQACSGDLLECLTRFRPDILLLDPVHLAQGLQTSLAEFTRRAPECEMLAYLDADNRSAATWCLAAGFIGVVSQQKGIEALVEAVTVARVGGIYVDESFTQAVSSSLEPEAVGRAQPNAALSERERYVLEHVARGLSNKEIAKRVSLSPKTVETHRARAMVKLGLRQRSDIVQHALRNNWLASEALAV